jgi:hypothetical protein
VLVAIDTVRVGGTSTSAWPTAAVGRMKLRSSASVAPTFT